MPRASRRLRHRLATSRRNMVRATTSNAVQAPCVTKPVHKRYGRAIRCVLRTLSRILTLVPVPNPEGMMPSTTWEEDENR
jgi:hypothetical protein